MRKPLTQRLTDTLHIGLRMQNSIVQWRTEIPPFTSEMHWDQVTPEIKEAAHDTDVCLGNSVIIGHALDGDLI